MNIKKFRKNLKKISKFDNWDNEANVNLTRIEKDILLEYIRKLYKSVLDEKVSNHIQKVQKNEKSNVSSPLKEIEKNELKNTIVPPGKVKIEPIVISDVEKPEVSKAEPVQNPEQSIEKSVEKSKAIKISEEFLAIFNDKALNELSEKLSMLPVDDVKKAFGLNEKIFTVNELFEGNNTEFEAAVKCLNELKSFTEAKDYILSSLAGKFNWDTELKLKKAEQFVRTIRRRYNN